MAQAPPDYGLTWRTIGNAGNAPAQQSDFPFDFPEPRGAVSYEFRMTQTEVTVGQLFEFVQAYTAVYPDTPTGGFNGLISSWIYRTGSPGTYQWHMEDAARNFPADVGWNFAAKYCNWLCNGKAVTAAAFASGAYDTSTFYPNPGNPQVVHSSGAQFWLASIDEWTKAMFYDPNKNGSGQPGYWWYPTRSDSPPVGGPPGTPGAQTSAGSFVDPNNPDHEYAVGSYPDVQSPWGILDGSGGVREWAEGPNNYEFRNDLGSSRVDTFPLLDDRIGRMRADAFWLPEAGIRLVSVVPAPGVGALLLTAAGAAFLPRRRCATGTA